MENLETPGKTRKVGRYDYIIPDHYSPSEKLVAALNVTGKCGAETIADKCSKTMQDIFPLLIFPSSYSYNY